VAALEKGAARGGVPVPDDLSKVPSGELEGLARALTQERRFGDLLRVAEEWARRGDLTADQRVEADMNVGYALRGMAKHAEAEARFRESLARIGEGSDKAPWLGFQIGWERSFQKDPAGASLEMEKAAGHAAVSPIVRVHALLAAANFAKEAGDTGRARVFLDRLLGTYAGDIPPTQAFIRQQAEALRKEITGE
jgi:hypothetical protein